MRWYLGIVLGLLIIFSVPASAASPEYSSTHIWSGEWQGHDLNVAVIARDRHVEHDVDYSEPWWKWGNASTDAYLFSWSEDRLIDLIVDFSVENNKPVARLYAPTTIQVRESISIRQGSYSMDPLQKPHLEIRAGRNTWIENGKPVFELTGREANPTTGEVDWEIRVEEAEPGVPEWITRISARPDDPEFGDPLFGATVRADESVEFEMAEPLIPTWPYLSGPDSEGHWGRIQPIYFSHETRTIEQNWTGFHIAGMYQINSLTMPPETNFESPFAFYRFDDSAGRHANLVVRSDIWPAGDRSGPPPYHQQRTAVRMTWTERQYDQWRYSITVNGQHAHEDSVMIGDTEIIAVPFDEYPRWITSRDWPAVSFVEAIDGEGGSEGIYEYSVEDNYPVFEYVGGLRPIPPVDPMVVPELMSPLTVEDLEHDPLATLHSPYLDFPAIHPLRLSEGFRGEFSLDYEGRPELYVSPVDNRVHLLNADEGIWNLGDGQVLRWTSSGDDPHVNSWWLEYVSTYESFVIDEVAVASPGRPTETLDLFEDAGFILYSSENSVELRTLNDSLNYDKVPIPDNEAKWNDFVRVSEGLEEEPRDPHDLANWISHLDGESMTVSGAHASGARATDKGFRFVIDLRANYELEGAELLNLGRLTPGRYLIEWDGEFSIRPLTPPRFTATLNIPELTALKSDELTLQIRNHGTEDLSDATLSVQAFGPRNWEVTIEDAAIDVFGKEMTTVSMKWAAPEAGRWSIRPVIVTADGEKIPLKGLTTNVGTPPQPNALQLIEMGSRGITIAVGFLTLFALAGVAGVTWWSQWRPNTMGQTDDRE
jgi:hypothetical protein